MGQHLRVERSEESGRHVVKLVGELDIATADLAEQAMVAGCDVLDVTELEFIDSVGIRVLLRDRMNRTERLTLRGVQPMIHRVLDLAGVAGEFIVIDAA